MITAFKPSKPDICLLGQNTLLETEQKGEKEDSFALMMKTPKETSVLIAFEKAIVQPTYIYLNSTKRHQQLTHYRSMQKETSSIIMATAM